MKRVLWSQAGRKFETLRHREKMLIIRCTVFEYHRSLTTEHRSACCSSNSWSIIPSQYLSHVPPSQRSKIAESADNEQEHLLCAMPLCLSSLESSGCVKTLFCFVFCVCVLFFCACNFVTNHFPMTFWSVASRMGRFCILNSVWHIVFYSGDPFFSTCFLS